MARPIYGYWDARGLGEPVRYLLNYKNVDFEDKRYKMGDMDAWKNEKFTLGLDFPNLPYYIDDNVKLTQSITILRYLAQKHGLDGRTDQDKLRISLAEQQVVDFRTSVAQLCYNPEFEKLRSGFEEKVLPQMKLVADFLGDRKFLVGDYITFVDFMAFDTIEYYRYVIPKVLKDFPNLKAYQDRIKNLPELQTYLKSSKRWPIFSTHAKFGGSGPEPELD